MNLKPGLSRAIPMAILGFILGVAGVQLIRTLQQMDPIWDPNVIFVVVPFTVTWFFMWGMGSFNPKMSEHAHGPDEAHAAEAPGTAIVPAEQPELARVEHAEAHEEEEAKPFALLANSLWKIATITIVLIVVIFAFATLPTGLMLRTVNEPEGNVAAVETEQNFLLPLGVAEVEASQLTVFVGFIIITLLSLMAFGGLIGLLFYALNRGVKQVEGEAVPEQRRPPAPLRWVSRGMSGMARGLRRGLPVFFGYKN